VSVYATINKFFWKTILSSVESIVSASQASLSVAQEELYNTEFVPQHFSPTECLTQKQDFRLLPTKRLSIYLT